MKLTTKHKQLKQNKKDALKSYKAGVKQVNKMRYQSLDAADAACKRYEQPYLDACKALDDYENQKLESKNAPR